MWRHLVVATVAASGALAGLLLFLPAKSRPFLAGVGVASLFWILFVAVRDVTGGGNLAMGAEAEGWTSAKLHRMRDWRCFDAIDLGGRDVDHVVIGPAGVYAVETKWSATKWSSRGAAASQLERHAASARRGSRDIRLRLHSHQVRLPVAPLLVLWGREFDESLPDVFHLDGVDIVKGKALHVWCRSRVADQLSSEKVLDATTALESFIAERDQMVRRRQSSARRVPSPSLGAGS